MSIYRCQKYINFAPTNCEKTIIEIKLWYVSIGTKLGNFFIGIKYRKNYNICVSTNYEKLCWNQIMVNFYWSKIMNNFNWNQIWKIVEKFS